MISITSVGLRDTICDMYRCLIGNEVIISSQWRVLLSQWLDMLTPVGEISLYSTSIIYVIYVRWFLSHHHNHGNTSSFDLGASRWLQHYGQLTNIFIHKCTMCTWHIISYLGRKTTTYRSKTIDINSNCEMMNNKLRYWFTVGDTYCRT
jgi:hypothetical protein